MIEPLLDAKDVSSLLHVHPKTVYRWASNGLIRHIKKGGILRFKSVDIDEWIESGWNGKNSVVDCLRKFDLSLENYDKMLLKRSNALSSKNSKRWCYGFGTVYIRKTKDGKTRFCIDYRGRDGTRKREVVKAAQTRAEALIVLQQRVSEVFEYTVNVDKAAKYALSARVVTPSDNQHLSLAVNGATETIDIALPFTVGMWDKTKPVVIQLRKGKNVLSFSRKHDKISGVTIKDFTMTPAK